MQTPRRNPLLSIVLAVALVLNPVLPVLAFMAPVDGGNDAQAHAHHPVPPADQQQLGDASKPCVQHDICNGQCCATCAQCVTAMLPLAPQFHRARPVRLSSAPPWHPQSAAGAHNRPPQAA